MTNDVIAAISENAKTDTQSTSPKRLRLGFESSCLRLLHFARLLIVPQMVEEGSGGGFMAIGISPTVDFAFKLMLGSPEHSSVTIHFLNAILGGQPKITEVEILNPFLGKDAEDDKLSVRVQSRFAASILRCLLSMSPLRRSAILLG